MNRNSKILLNRASVLCLKITIKKMDIMNTIKFTREIISRYISLKLMRLKTISFVEFSHIGQPFIAIVPKKTV
jgi:hypothetical protein